MQVRWKVSRIEWDFSSCRRQQDEEPAELSKEKDQWQKLNKRKSELRNIKVFCTKRARARKKDHTESKRCLFHCKASRTRATLTFSLWFDSAQTIWAEREENLWSFSSCVCVCVWDNVISKLVKSLRSPAAHSRVRCLFNGRKKPNKSPSYDFWWRNARKWGAHFRDWLIDWLGW